ncbi:MAG: addiction module protein [Verrucomicrobiaceae bacterium]|nr:MAG: addiction module protein [Verrucomicrobiaceae bacterium]
MDAAILEKEALLLPDTERALLVERLMESISPYPSALREAWVREADERMRAFRDGEISAVDGPQAMAELRSRFSK